LPLRTGALGIVAASFFVLCKDLSTALKVTNKKDIAKSPTRRGTPKRTFDRFCDVLKKPLNLYQSKKKKNERLFYNVSVGSY
tara:strand:+ start:398 stop:643 length:246 start_codon:yes stop_codon:yes gene_type:complete